MSWYMVSLTSADISTHKDVKMQEAFEALFMANRAPADAAMFGASTPGNPNVDFYFSPGGAALASSLIASYGGTSCSRPTVPVSLLVGHADASERLLQ